MSNENTRTRPTRIGVVVSDKMNKSAVVAVETPFKHPRYKKYIRRTKKFMIHDERNECEVGDKVLIVQDHSRSKRKSWRLRRIVNKLITPVVVTAVEAERPEQEVEKEAGSEEE